jgi:hypothetical protein
VRVVGSSHGAGVPANSLGAPGATAIAEALKGNTTITNVDLQGED